MGVNADKINMMKRDPALRSIVNGCAIINADGASVVLASRFLNQRLPERVAGIDLMQDLIGLSDHKGYSVYLLGARQNVVEKAAQCLLEKHRGLRICGFRNGYFGQSEWEPMAREIASAAPEIIFVGIKSPEKEYLIDFLQRQGLDCVFMGVGGSFDVISGLIPRAPTWMQRTNLEWLFRLFQEPKRLWKRYLVGNSMFILGVLWQKFARNEASEFDF
jgi:N-acetylglucosaminyldiphosphoundecaprenol N-acetyl-beta-D-mannosaminyltransferase